ncbi:MAG: efflux RND transporter periplasmic adaptor subunit [Anaerolineae bacterium]|nr:efflux RND transporter periplasmic adaptor subunit [Anaerolineae bacterium]
MKLKIVSIVFIALASACSGLSQPESTPTPIPRSVASTKPTYEVQRGEIVSQLQFAGRVTPVTQAELSFPQDGRVGTVYVAEGDEVTAGTVLAELALIDDLRLQKQRDDLTVRKAELELENAQLALEAVEADADHTEQARSIAQNNVELAQIRMDEVQLTIQDLDAAIANAQIIAPFDGQVLTIGTAEGRTISAFSPVAVIGDMSEIEVAALLQSDRIGRLEEGQQVTIQASGKPDVVVTGTIRRLPYLGGNAESDDPSVRISLDTPAEEAGLEVDDQVEITLVLEQREDVLWLPQQAVRTFENTSFVVVRDGDVEQRADVVVGIQGGGRTEIVEGLEEGQVVVGP